MLLRELPDVLLLDLNMPQVSGFDVLAAMRADPVLKHIQVIVLTSADDAQTKLKALDLGASDFLRKPVDPSELALRLRNTLAAKAHREALRKTFVRYVSPRLAEGIINDAAAPFAAGAGAPSSPSGSATAIGVRTGVVRKAGSPFAPMSSGSSRRRSRRSKRGWS